MDVSNAGSRWISCDAAGAAIVGGMFAADLLSWSEDDPRSRGSILAEYVRQPRQDAMEVLAFLGWSGRGHQRVVAVVIGTVMADEFCARVTVRVHAQVVRSDRAVRLAHGRLSSDALLKVYSEGADGRSGPVVSGELERGNERCCWTQVDVPVMRADGLFVIDVNEAIAEFDGIDLDGENCTP